MRRVLRTHRGRSPKEQKAGRSILSRRGTGTDAMSFRTSAVSTEGCTRPAEHAQAFRVPRTLRPCALRPHRHACVAPQTLPAPQGLHAALARRKATFEPHTKPFLRRQYSQTSPAPEDSMHPSCAGKPQAFLRRKQSVTSSGAPAVQAYLRRNDSQTLPAQKQSMHPSCAGKPPAQQAA